MGDVSEEIREKLAIVLDVDDLVVALRIARDLRPWFGTAKVGLMVADRQRAMLQMLPGAFDADDQSAVPGEEPAGRETAATRGRR